MSSVKVKSKTYRRPVGNDDRRKIDYVNVAFAAKEKGTKNFQRSFGEHQRVNPEPTTASNRFNLSSSTDSVDGPLATSKGKEPKQRREKNTKTKMKKQLWSTLLESDSSSMDGLSMSSEVLEAKAREEEHYNKLKLNLNQLENKSVRKGVSVLYVDKINGEFKPPHSPTDEFRPRSSSGTRLTRTSQGGTAGPDGPIQQAEPPVEHPNTPSLVAANKEGHANRLHSVSGRSTPRSPSIMWKKATLPKSFSTGDMNRIVEETDGAEGEENKPKALTRRSQSFSEATQTAISKKIAEAAAMVAVGRKKPYYENVNPSNDVTVQVEPPTPDQEDAPLMARSETTKTSVRRRDQHSKQRHSVLRSSFTQSAEVLQEISESMAINVSSEAKSQSYLCSYDPCTSPTPFFSPTRSPTRQNARLSPLARPTDMKTAPLSPLLQPVALHNDACPITCTCHGIRFIDSIVTIPCDSNGGEYMSEAHEFKIVIPKGAIKKRLTVELQIGITLQGPFQVPQNTNIVSPIVWIGVRPDTKLKKPIEVKLPHFLDLCQGSQKSDFFLKASDKANSSCKAKYSTTLKRFSFKETSDSQAIFKEGHGILVTKSLGFFCIATSKPTKYRACCCLLPIIPKPIQNNTWKVHYCVTYLLKSCIQLVQRQFGTEWEMLPLRKFKFADEGALEIQFERQLLEAGWILALESSNKILANEVDLWSCRDGLCEGISSYPPRFTIRVHGGEARMSSVALIKFTGCSDPLSSEIVLPMRPSYSIGGDTPLSTPTSSVFSPQHHSAASSQDSNFMATSMVHPVGTRLGWQCHSPSCDCDMCSHDYDHLPSTEELAQTHVQLTYHNGHIDLPTDEDLRNIATKVTQSLQGDWTTLQTSLDIPDHIMLDVLSQRSIELQVYSLLKKWRKHAKDCSKDKLAECLAKADHRLEAVSTDLLSPTK